ncbi:MAG: carboxyl-terminal processing protease [Pirellulaceae bacterium]|nr:MAG: carboxyl-terminal processing protease [Pirellulaceae bacterium]
MSRWAVRGAKLLLWLFPLLVCLQAAPVATRAQVAVEPDAVRQILQQGDELEQQRRWHDALLHYEQAIREWPDAVSLRARVDRARVHWDVQRRCRDLSFGQLAQADTRQALSLLNEVLWKIETYYVDPPRWAELFEHGWRTWETACQEPEFWQLYRQAAPAALGPTNAQLRQQIARFRLADRRDLYNAAAFCAQQIEQQRLAPATAVLLEITCGVVTALDEYTAFLTPGQLDELLSQIEGQFVGLGVEIKPEPGSLLIVSVLPGGPAAEAGLAPGERIVSVNGQLLEEITAERGADLLRGPDGSQVKIRVRRQDGHEQDLVLVRRRIDVPSVERIAMLDPQEGVGYFRLTSFQKTTPRDVDAALWQLHRQGMRSLIIDLRGNPGGLLSAAVEVADRFLSQGPIVATRGRNSGEDYDYRAHAVGTWSVPLVVLIDRDSASASEIFAAAIRDQRRGTLVGQPSFGKGSVQGIFPLQTLRAGLRLTTARYYAPSGQPIGHQGIGPDVPVHVAARPTGSPAPLLVESDAALRAALQTAREAARRLLAGR